MCEAQADEVLRQGKGRESADHDLRVNSLMTNIVNIRDYHPKPKPKSMDDITMEMIDSWGRKFGWLWGVPTWRDIRGCEVVKLPERNEGK